MADKPTPRSKSRPSRLGRGLSSLMNQPVRVGPTTEQAVAGDPALDPTPPPSATPGPAADADADSGVDRSAPAGDDEPGADAIRFLPLDALEPNPHQPRQRMDGAGLERLAASIRADGLMQPVIARPRSDDDHRGPDHVRRFEIVAGERRWRAARLAGLDRLPVIVRELDDRQTAEWALIENLQREDLNPIDRAEAFAHLTERFGLSHEQIAERVGVDRSSVTNLLRLLSLAEPVKQMVRDGLLSMGQARAIAGVADGAAQKALAEQAVRKALSVRDVESLARRGAATGDGQSKRAGGKGGGRPGHLVDLERQIGQQLGTRVTIRTGRRKGSGTLSIDFYSLDQFDALLARLGVEAE